MAAQYPIPDEIVDRLQKLYSDSKYNITEVLDSFIRNILDYTFMHGECMIRGFGKFECYKIVDENKVYDNVKFKFTPSQSLRTKIKNNLYLIKRVKIKQKVTGDTYYNKSYIVDEDKINKDSETNIKTIDEVFNELDDDSQE